MNTVYLGADPGKQGAIAVLDPRGAPLLLMRWSKHDVLDVQGALRALCVGLRIVGVIESVSSSPQMGRASAFTFGKEYGSMRATLVLSGVALYERTPQTWQKHQRCSKAHTKATSQADHKRALVALAKERFPGVKVTADLADALLIAEFCRQEYGAKP